MGECDWILASGTRVGSIRGERYNPVVTAGSTLRVGLGKHAQFGLGGQWKKEAVVEGHIYAPYDTPGVDYEDWIRGEVVRLPGGQPHHGRPLPDPEPATPALATRLATLALVNWAPFNGTAPMSDGKTISLTTGEQTGLEKLTISMPRRSPMNVRF